MSKAVFKRLGLVVQCMRILAGGISLMQLGNWRLENYAVFKAFLKGFLKGHVLYNCFWNHKGFQMLRLSLL